MEYEATNFEYEVIEQSFRLPIVVDFWAPWCGPCQFLGPIIEKLAAEAEGKWELVKVNVDEHPDISQMFHIRGIPAVKMFAKGRVVAEFSGALPEGQIRQWLKTHIPSEVDDWVFAAENLFAEEKMGEAKALLEKALAIEPQHPQAAFQLAKIVLLEDPNRAEGLLHIALHEPKNIIFIESMQKMVKLLQIAHRPELLEDVPVKPIFLTGLKSLSEREFGAALEKFIQVVTINKSFHHEAAKDACIAIFHYLGEQHDITKQYRRKFSMALY
jgi:putative thioredoxin